MTALPTPEATRDGDTRVRDAASVVIVDYSGPAVRVLMGRRPQSQVFLPNKWVFPGGRVDDQDHRLAATFAASEFPAGLPEALRPFALAALRELYEETGLLLSSRTGALAAEPNELKEWQAFLWSNRRPDPLHLVPLARAVTPPGRVRRYDTWFFLTARDRVVERVSFGDGELKDLDWFTIAGARELDLPNITRRVLEDIADAVRRGTGASPRGIPYYHHDGCVFQRTLIPVGT